MRMGVKITTEETTFWHSEVLSDYYYTVSYLHSSDWISWISKHKYSSQISTKMLELMTIAEISQI